MLGGCRWFMGNCRLVLCDASRPLRVGVLSAAGRGLRTWRRRWWWNGATGWGNRDVLKARIWVGGDARRGVPLGGSGWHRGRGFFGGGQRRGAGLRDRRTACCGPRRRGKRWTCPQVPPSCGFCRSIVVGRPCPFPVARSVASLGLWGADYEVAPGRSGPDVSGGPLNHPELFWAERLLKTYRAGLIVGQNRLGSWQAAPPVRNTAWHSHGSSPQGIRSAVRGQRWLAPNRPYVQKQWIRRLVGGGPVAAAATSCGGPAAA